MFRKILIGCVATATATQLRGTTGTIDMEKALTDMQPEMVAHLLSEVEKRWEESRVASLRKQVDESAAVAEMSKSCAKVTKAIIQGSDGDKDKVVEYMHDVCGSKNTDSKTCDGFAAGVEGFMSNDAEVNRNDLDLSKFCQGYWADAVTKAASEEVKRLDAEDAARAKEEEEKKKREEEEAKAKEAEEAKKATEAATNQQAKDLAEAQSLAKTASDDEAKVSADEKETQAQIQLQQTKVDNMVDDARKAVQLASEKDSKAAEAKAAEEAKPAEFPVLKTQVNAPAADEVAAEKAGDAQADKIAEKAIENAQKAVEKAQEHIKNDKEETVDDTKEAVSAGDKLADKIAAKAESKVASKPAMIATKTTKPVTAIKVDASEEVAKYKVFFRVKETKKNGTTQNEPVKEVDVAFNEKPLVKEIEATANQKH